MTRPPRHETVRGALNAASRSLRGAIETLESWVEENSGPSKPDDALGEVKSALADLEEAEQRTEELQAVRKLLDHI